MFQQSRRTKSSNQMILSFQNWFAIYDFLHILRKLQILSISVVLTEQISSEADLFSYLVPWIPFTNLKFMRATDWFKNPQNLISSDWYDFCHFWKGWFFKALKKSLLPPKRDPAKVIEKMTKKNIIKPFHHLGPDFGLPSPCGAWYVHWPTDSPEVGMRTRPRWGHRLTRKKLRCVRPLSRGRLGWHQLHHRG